MKKFKFLLIVMLGFFFLASCSLDQTKYPTTPGDDEITEGEESYTLTFKYYDSLETIVSYTKKITNPVLESDISVTVPNGYALSFVDEEGQVVEVEDIRTTSTIYVKFSPKEYTLRFIEGGTVVNELLVAYNETIEAIEATKVPTGKKFIGWSSSEDEYVEYVFDKMPSESVVLYAFYEELTYSITLQTNVVALEGYNNVVTYKYGDRLGNFVPSDLQAAIDSIENYVFAGWYLDEACTDKFDEIAMPAKNITLYAKWDYAGLTFFDGNSIIEVFDGELGDQIVFPEAPEKAGYTFVGWFYDEELTQEVLANAVITEDLHAIYAKYSSNERPYKVEYYLQSFGVSYVLNVGATINAKGNTGDLVVAEIKSFEGFTHNANLQGNVLEGNVLGDGSLVLKVYYTRNSYSIKFYTDGNLYHEATLKYGAGVVAPSNPSKVGYTFNGWDVTVPATMPAEDVEINALWNINKYTITFNVNGGTAVQSITQDYATAVTKPADPTKVGYTFAGWDQEVPATMPAENITINAKWNINKYTITWKNWDGTTLETDSEVEHFSTPSYNAATPTKAANAQYTYTFKGWSPVVETVTGDATYVAQFDSTVNEYTVTWKNWDGTTLETDENVPYGTTPSYDAATPTKATNAQYTYTFKGWSPVVETVTGDATYVAQFDSTVNEYTVTWKNWDGTTLETDENVPYGTIPSYNAATPTKPATAEHTYGFLGWDNEVVAVTENVTYTAQFTSTINRYDVVWKNWDGTTLETDEDVLYGTTPSYDGATPTKAADAQYTYTFIGWAPAVSTVTGEVTYTAQFSSTVNEYTVTWLNWDGSELAKQTVAYGVTPAYTGTPSRVATAQYTYTFNAWSPAVVAVTGDATYTAQYIETVNEYTVTWLNWDGSELAAQTVAYGETPAYIGTPSRPSTAQYTYTFNAWSPAVVAVEGDATYTAQYSETVNEYTVTWLNWDGSELATQTVAYGETPAYTGTPSRVATAEYTYTFNAWSPAVVAVEGDATYTAQYNEIPNIYTITFNTNGGSEVASITKEYGSVIEEVETPTRTGYTFGGWDVEIPTTMPAENMTITASWNVIEYSISYDTDGGVPNIDDIIADFLNDYNTARGKSHTVESFYALGLWSEISDASLFLYNATYKAKWTWLVNYIAEVAGSDNKVAFETFYNYSTQAELDAADSNNIYSIAYELRGWVGQAKYSQNASFITADYSTESVQSVILEYISANKYTIETSEIVLPELRKFGYTFDGWFMNGTKVTSISSGSTGDKELVAKFTKQEYSFELNLNGGELPNSYYVQVPTNPIKVLDLTIYDNIGEASGTYLCDTSITTNNFLRWQYKILLNEIGSGWYEIVALDAATAKANDAASAAGVTWTHALSNASENITTQVAVGQYIYIEPGVEVGDTNFTATVSDSTNMTSKLIDLFYGPLNPHTLGEPTKEDYAFAGWYTNPEFTGEPVTVLDNQGQNIVLYAKWNLEKYNVTFVSNGSTYLILPCDVNAMPSMPVNPTRDGYVFAGWYSNELFEGNEIVDVPEEETTLYAKWIKQVTIVTNDGYYSYASFDEVITDLKADLASLGITSFNEWSYSTSLYKVFTETNGKWDWLLRYFIEVSDATYQSVLADTAFQILLDRTEETDYTLFTKANYGSNGYGYFMSTELYAFVSKAQKYVYSGSLKSANYADEVVQEAIWDFIIANDNKTIDFNEAYELPQTLYKEGYIFRGWYTNSAFTGEAVTSVATTVTVYAKWDEKGSVIELTDGDIQALAQLGDYPDIIVDPSFTNEKYTLNGQDYNLGVNCFASIQEAIDAANEGDTIYVFAGTYADALDINKANVTLAGPNYNVHGNATRASEANITGLTTISAANVTVNGLKFSGSGAIKVGADNVTISNIHMTATQVYPGETSSDRSNRKGCIVDSADISGLSVIDSYINAPGSSNSYTTQFMTFYNVTDLTIKGNYITNGNHSTASSSYAGMRIYNAAGTLTITENIIEWGTTGYLFVLGDYSNTCTKIDIIDNVFAPNDLIFTTAGFQIKKGSSSQVVNIIGNTFNSCCGSMFIMGYKSNSTYYYSQSKVNVMYNYFDSETSYKNSYSSKATYYYENNYYETTQTTSTSDYGVVESYEELKELYRIWKLPTHSVTLNTNGGTLSTDLTTYKETIGATLPTPTKEGYNFLGWYDNNEFNGVAYTAISTTANTDLTFYAKWEIKKFTVTWKNGEETLETDENVPYGEIPTYDGSEPTKAADAQYTYTFAGWSPAESPVTGEVTYTATFDATLRKYTVIWENYDGTVLGTNNIEFGQMPSYSGETPTKDPDEDYIYLFSTWTPSIEIVTGDMTYTAVFDKYEEVTVTTVIADYATANGWTNGNAYTTLNMDENVIINTSTGGNTAKYYTNGNNWRFYQTNNSTLTISVAEGLIISAKITYVSDKTGVLTCEGDNISSGTLVTINSNTVTFSVGNTDSSITNGQARITAIEVVYLAKFCEHNYVYSSTIESTCSTVGEEKSICSKCGKESIVEIPMKHHAEIQHDAVDATCSTAGNAAYVTCENCSYSTYVEIPATGEHNYVDGVCSVCGEEEASEPQEVTATLSFANTSNRTVGTTSQQTWVENGITFTNNKGSSSSDVNISYYNPVRLYAKSNAIIVAPGNIKTIVITCSSGTYATAMANSIGEIDGATVTTSGSVVTVTYDTPNTTTLEISSFTAQTRVNSIKITYLA